MKQHLLKKCTLSIVFLLFLFCVLLSGCAGRRALTTEAFTSACEAAGYTIEDMTEQFDTASLETALSVSEEETTLGFFVFSDADVAKTNYAQMLSSLKTGASDEKFVDSAEYNRLYVSTDSGTTLLYRNGGTLLLATSTDTEKLGALIDALGI